MIEASGSFHGGERDLHYAVKPIWLGGRTNIMLFDS